MNIYLVSQTEDDDYDTFDSFVIACNTIDEAIDTSPYGHKVDWDKQANKLFTAWAKHRGFVTAKLIGVTNEYQEPQIILASFNAG